MIVGLRKDVAPPTCVLQTKCDLEAILHFGDIPPEIQCPKTAVVGQKLMINFQRVLTIGVRKQSQMSKVGC